MRGRRAAHAEGQAPVTSLPEILPCPFCGSKSVSVQPTDEDGAWVAVRCHGCQAQGPEQDSHSNFRRMLNDMNRGGGGDLVVLATRRAIEGWNKRAGT